MALRQCHRSQHTGALAQRGRDDVITYLVYPAGRYFLHFIFPFLLQARLFCKFFLGPEDHFCVINDLSLSQRRTKNGAGRICLCIEIGLRRNNNVHRRSYAVQVLVDFLRELAAMHRLSDDNQKIQIAIGRGGPARC